MSKEDLIFLSIIAFLIFGIIGIIMYYTTGEWVTVRAKIIKKHCIAAPKIILVGGVPIAWTDYYYYFIMDNGDKVQVSYSDYMKYEVGDYYEYRKRIG